MGVVGDKKKVFLTLAAAADLLEPVFKAAGGWDPIKLQVQTCTTALLAVSLGFHAYPHCYRHTFHSTHVPFHSTFLHI